MQLYFSDDELMKMMWPEGKQHVTEVGIGTDKKHTIKFLNFRTPNFFAVIYLKFKERG